VKILRGDVGVDGRIRIDQEANSEVNTHLEDTVNAHDYQNQVDEED